MTAASASAYTPLEALLLFQYLRSHGVAPAAFAKVSDLLRHDDQICNATSFDAGRLSPDALRDFFTRLLKEEAKSEALPGGSTGDHDGQNGHVLSSSRKRKARSPSLPSTHEALSNERLVPHLIQKLYARYREHAIIEIREEERRYKDLRQEYADIEQGKWDARLQKNQEREQEESAVKKQVEAVDELSAETLPAPPVDGPVTATKEPSSQEPPTEAAGQPSAAQNRLPALAPPLATSPKTRAPVFPQIPQQEPPSLSPRPSLPQPNGPTHQEKSSALLQSPYAQHPSPSTVNVKGQDADTQSKPLPSPGMPPPPVPGTPHTPHALPPYPPYANNAHPPSRLTHQAPYPPPSQASPSNVQQVQQYPTPQLPYPPQAAQPGHGPNRGGVMLQPFTVSAQTPTGVRQPPLPLAPNQPGNRPLFSTPIAPAATPSTPNPSALRSAPFSPYDIAKLLATSAESGGTPVGAPSPSRSPETKWNAIGRSTRAVRKASPARPSERSVSPISEHGPSPPPEASMTTRSSRRGKQAAAPETATQQPSRRLQTRRIRGASVTSSVLGGGSIRGRTRSQSVISHAEDVSMVDNDSVSGRRVKNEPSTPADSFDQVRPTIESTPNSAAGSTRRFALQSNINKRKRGARGTSESSDTVIPHPRHDKSMVLAMRNFPRLSSTVMNDILSHKHASLFGAPVREKDAEGYTTMIRRPQDLKSIRTAIAAGAKAVNAATADSTSTAPTSSPRDAGGTVSLPITEDLIPPRGIVNSAQLEKEVMRMFTNAVMFNPGEDDVVQDAREMFEDVQQHIANFRSLERVNTARVPPGEASRRSEVDTVEEEEQTTVSKRRRM